MHVWYRRTAGIFARSSCLRSRCRRSISSNSSDFGKRVAQIDRYVAPEHRYPRLPSSEQYVPATSIRELQRITTKLDSNETLHSHTLKLSGRITSIRWAGSKLAFLDLEADSSTFQIVCEISSLKDAGLSDQALQSFRHVARRGDWYTAVGHPHRTQRGEMSLLATQLPTLDSPSLHQIPKVLEDAETSARKPHLHMMTSPTAVKTLKNRSLLEHHLSVYLFEQGFTKVNTPILSASAGGAVARPFETMATELRDTRLSLRIAPELWLKRLVVGGMGRVYEIGPAFRNEGVDATHNPEFSICEFYMPYANLEHLMTMTQNMLASLKASVFTADSGRIKSDEDPIHELQPVSAEAFIRLPFIPTLEAQMKHTLPDLDGPDATRALIELVSKHRLMTLPSNPTLPRLLDALSSQYIEPLCTKPTFITEHPSALSPLSKSFRCPKTNQTVSARAELFIRGVEYANMYEEENSPTEQRRKFEQQNAYRGTDDASAVDESYLEALEYGLPPTGGWGMGLDRLAMLFTGSQRISDVLPFGTLRNVVGLVSKTSR